MKASDWWQLRYFTDAPYSIVLGAHYTIYPVHTDPLNASWRGNQVFKGFGL